MSGPMDDSDSADDSSSCDEECNTPPAPNTSLASSLAPTRYHQGSNSTPTLETASGLIFDPTMSRTSFQSASSAPMMSSSVGASSMPQQSSMMSNMRGGAPMPPNMRMGMDPAYQTGQGMHPGMHGMQSHPGQMGQQSRMMGPMRVGMATPSHVMSMDGQMGRPGMVNQMGPQGMHPQMRTQFHNYGPHGMSTAVQQPQMGPRMVPNYMGMSHMRQMNQGMNPAAMGRPGMPMTHNMAPGGQQTMSMRMPNPGMVQQQQQSSVASSQPQAENKMQGAPQNQTSDPEKRKQIQQQLGMLLHAHKCQRRERDQQATCDYRPCTLPHCKTMKSVLNHMTECQVGRLCTYAHCATSRQIINHWRRCVRPDCPVCLPHRQKEPTSQPADVPGMTQSGSGLGTGSGIGSNAPPDLGQNTGFGPNPRMGMGQNPSGMGPTPSGMAPGGSMMNVPRPNAGPSHMMPTEGGMVDPNRAGTFQGRDMIRPYDYPNPRAGISNTPSTFILPIPPIMSNPTQPWQVSMNPDLRQHLVRKIVEAIYPVHDPTALRDVRVKTYLIPYAMKVEKVMFEAAQSREEYYKLLAQKIYLIRIDLEDRKRNRNRGGQMSPMMNEGDPTHQGDPGQPPSVPSNSSQYPQPSTLDVEVPPLPSNISNPVPSALTPPATDKIKYQRKFDELVRSTEQKIDMSYLKLYLIGLPGVGKTTFRKRLTRTLVNISSLPHEERQHFSTHLAESIQTLCLIKDKSKLDLEPSEDRDQEARAIFKYLQRMTSEKSIGIHNSNLGPSEEAFDAEQEAQLSPIEEPNQGLSVETVEDLNVEQKDTNFNQGEVSVATSGINDILKNLREIISTGNYEDVLSMHTILINIIDVGGQPGFLEMLPFVCGGPGMFFVCFPLDKEFDQQYPVYYQRGNHRITPYEAKFTIRETISQILSGISYHTTGKCQSTTDDLQKRILSIKPTVTLFGTFRDKLKLQIEHEIILNRLQSQYSDVPKQELNEEVESVLLKKYNYEKGSFEPLQSEVSSKLRKAINEHLSSKSLSEEAEGKLISTLENKHQSVKEAVSKKYFGSIMVNPPGNKGLFEIDNYNGTDKDIEPIRAHIQTCLNDESRFVKVPVHPAQLLFAIILRREYRIISKEECRSIGTELNMTEEDLKFTLWYFNQLGTLIYRDELKHVSSWFEDNVICSPQAIFDSIGQLIIQPLLKLHSTCEASKLLFQKERDDWSERGQFSIETIKRCFTNEANDSDYIPLEHLITFLQHVHLLSPISTREVSCCGEIPKIHYFMPAVLECASEEELYEIPSTTTPTSLLIFFKYGSSSIIADSVPMGLFCAMVAKLVTDGYNDIFGKKWELDDTRSVKRNLISFHVGCYGHRVTLVSHATCYEIRVSLVSGDGTINLHDLCVSIYTSVMITLKVLNVHTSPSIGFLCPCGRHKDSKRLLENCCIVTESSIDCAIKCEKSKTIINLLKYSQLYPWIIKEIQPNQDVLISSAIPFNLPESDFSFTWFRKGSSEVLSSKNELEISHTQVKSGDFYKCQIKRDNKLYCTIHHFLVEASNSVEDPRNDGPPRTKKGKPVLEANNQASSSVEDPGNDGPPRTKTRKLVLEANNQEKSRSTLGKHFHASQYVESNAKRSKTVSLSDTISPNDHQEVYEQLVCASANWHDLGGALGLDQNTLKAIDIEYRGNTQDCLREMLTKRLQSGSHLSWEILCDCLRSRTVRREDVAEDIEKELGELAMEDLQRKTKTSNCQLDTMIREEDLCDIAGHFDCVENFLDRLRLTASQQAHFEDLAERQDIQTAVTKALKYWRQPNPSIATYRTLLQILLDLKRGDVADRICQYITENIPKHK